MTGYALQATPSLTLDQMPELTRNCNRLILKMSCRKKLDPEA